MVEPHLPHCNLPLCYSFHSEATIVPQESLYIHISPHAPKRVRFLLSKKCSPRPRNDSLTSPRLSCIKLSSSFGISVFSRSSTSPYVALLVVTLHGEVHVNSKRPSLLRRQQQIYLPYPNYPFQTSLAKTHRFRLL